MADVFLRVPAEFEGEFTTIWQQLRLSEGLDASFDLRNGETVDRFDGHGLAEWVVPLTSAMTPLVTAILGYLAARRGEVIYRNGETVYEYKGFSPSDIKKMHKDLEKPPTTGTPAGPKKPRAPKRESKKK
jgi:hypothetical protein